MYPFASLPENLTAFCAMLRREHGFRVGPRELRDAAQALQVIPIADERTVRDALRPVLSRTFEQALVFDRAFRAFFRPAAALPADQPGVERRERLPGAAGEKGAGTPAVEPDLPPDPVAGEGAGRGLALDVVDAGGPESAGLLRSSYSPVAGESAPPDLVPADLAWREAAAALVMQVKAGLSRRWRPALHGPRFDFRRMLRFSLHTGGEPVLPRWTARSRLHPRFVVIIDGSRSMTAHTFPALRTAVAMASVTPYVEVFVFSTALRRITADVGQAAAGERRR